MWSKRKTVLFVEQRKLEGKGDQLTASRVCLRFFSLKKCLRGCTRPFSSWGEQALRSVRRGALVAERGSGAQAGVCSAWAQPLLSV